MTEWINTTASVLTCISIMAAVIGWYVAHFQTRDAHLMVHTRRNWKGENHQGPVYIIQNIGNYGAILQMICFEELEPHENILRDDSSNDTVMLLPGEKFQVPCEITGHKPVITVVYSTQRNVNIVHIQRFDMNSLMTGTDRLQLSTIGIRRWISSWYWGGTLFPETGYANIHRRILLGSHGYPDVARYENAIMQIIKNGKTTLFVNGGELGEWNNDENEHE